MDNFRNLDQRSITYLHPFDTTEEFYFHHD